MSGIGDFRQRVIEEWGAECFNNDCPTPNAPIKAHHVNGDRDDNMTENGRPFCVSCHDNFVHDSNTEQLSEWTEKLPNKSLWGVDRRTNKKQELFIGLWYNPSDELDTTIDYQTEIEGRLSCLLGVREYQPIYWRLEDDSLFGLGNQGYARIETECDSVRQFLHEDAVNNQWSLTNAGEFLKNTAPVNGEFTVLTNRHAQVFALDKFTDIQRKSIAEEWGISPNTYDNQRRRARGLVVGAQRMLVGKMP